MRDVLVDLAYAEEAFADEVEDEGTEEGEEGEEQ